MRKILDIVSKRDELSQLNLHPIPYADISFQIPSYKYTVLTARSYFFKNTSGRIIWGQIGFNYGLTTLNLRASTKAKNSTYSPGKGPG